MYAEVIPRFVAADGLEVVSHCRRRVLEFDFMLGESIMLMEQESADYFGGSGTA